MMIDFLHWEAQIILEALRRLDAEGSDVIATTDDDDVRADYGSDLAQLQIVQKRFNAVEQEEFGPDVSTFSRELL